VNVLNSLLAAHAAPVWLVLAAAVTAGGLLRGLTGFGASLLMAPLLTQVVSARETMSLIILMSALPFGLAKLTGVGRQVDRDLIVPLTVAALIGLPCGLWLISVIPANLFGSLIGMFVIASAIALVFGLNLARHRSVPLSLGIGAMSGMLTGFAGIGGPPAILYVLGVESDSHRARATFIVYFALLYPLALAAIVLMGMLPLVELIQGLLLAPLFYLGGCVGERIFCKVRKEHFRPFVLALLICAGCLAIFRSGTPAQEVQRSDLDLHTQAQTTLVRLALQQCNSVPTECDTKRSSVALIHL
jgi:uncharacterized membrane protein YfcA